MDRYFLGSFVGFLAIAGCSEVSGSDTYAVRNGPQSISVMGVGSDGPTAMQPLTVVAGQRACPAGAILVTVPSGKTSCAQSGGVPVAVGATSVFDPSVAETLLKQSRDTGRAAAYSDGEYTVVTYATSR